MARLPISPSNTDALFADSAPSIAPIGAQVVSRKEMSAHAMSPIANPSFGVLAHMRASRNGCQMDRIAADLVPTGVVEIHPIRYSPDEQFVGNPMGRSRALVVVDDAIGAAAIASPYPALRLNVADQAHEKALFARPEPISFAHPYNLTSR